MNKRPYRKHADTLTQRWHGPEGWIYAAQEEGAPLVKIGCTTKLPRSRMHHLPSESQAALTLVGSVFVSDHRIYTIERAVHALLAPQHIYREWFYLSMTQERLEQLVAKALTKVLAGKDG